MTLTDLHPAVQKAVGELYADGHYATAIEAATKALEVAVREQSGLPAGGNLMGRAFAGDDPVPRIHHRRPGLRPRAPGPHPSSSGGSTPPASVRRPTPEARRGGDQSRYFASGRSFGSPGPCTTTSRKR